MRRGPLLPLVSAVEVDAFSRRSRGRLSWGRGELAHIKRSYAKRARREGRREARVGELDCLA